MAEESFYRRLDQIQYTAHRVIPTEVGEWKAAGNRPLSPADAVVIAPADFLWMLSVLRATPPAQRTPEADR